MKKLLIVLLALLVVSLCGCGGEAGEESSEVVNETEGVGDEFPEVTVTNIEYTNDGYPIITAELIPQFFHKEKITEDNFRNFVFMSVEKREEEEGFYSCDIYIKDHYMTNGKYVSFELYNEQLDITLALGTSNGQGLITGFGYYQGEFRYNSPSGYKTLYCSEEEFLECFTDINKYKLVASDGYIYYATIPEEYTVSVPDEHFGEIKKYYYSIGSGAEMNNGISTLDGLFWLDEDFAAVLLEEN